MSRARAALLASDPAVEEVAAAELASSAGSAVAAVVAGYFAAAGRHPGVLLAPLSLLIGGVGQSGRVFDGRWCQPGRGARRPRGLLPGAEIPTAARIAVPTSIAALAVALVYESGLSLAPLVRHGIAAAERASSPARAALLTRVAGVGPIALTEQGFVQPMLRLAAASQGGLITPTDFSAPAEIEEAAAERSDGSRRWIEPPWSREPVPPQAQLGQGHAIVAVDAHGRFVALAYRVLEQGLAVPELGVTAPIGAIPVQRGVPRIAPGKRLSSPAPLAIVRGEGSGAVEVLADPLAENLSFSAPSNTLLSIRRDPRSRLVTARR
jgi:hypothetical protein